MNTTLAISRSTRRRWVFVAGIATWLLTVAIGFFLLLNYQFKAGKASAAPRHWPNGTALHLHRKVPTLVMVVHPRCSCSRASIAELSRLMTRLHGQMQGYVVFVRPPGIHKRNWEKTDLWDEASIIDGIQVVSDIGGVEAKRFDAETSGQTYLYSTDGRLLFSGGITPSRSHQGNSIGRERIISLVTTGHADRAVSDVFGCAVFE